MNRSIPFTLREYIHSQFTEPETTIGLIEKSNNVVFTFKIALLKATIHIFTSNPLFNKHIMDNPQNYGKSPEAPLGSSMRDTRGKGSALGQTSWEQDRKIIMPYLGAEKLNKQIPSLFESIKETLPSIEVLSENGENFNIDSYMSTLTLKNLLKEVFGGAELDIQRTIKSFRDYLTLISPSVLPKIKLFGMLNPLYFKYKSVLNQCHKICGSIVEQCVSDQTQDNPIKALFKIYTANKYDQPMHEIKNRLIANTFQLMLAGFDTVNTLTTRIIVILSLHPLIMDCVREEIQSKIKIPNPNFDDLKNLTYLRAVINETLRLYPPTSQVVRFCLNDDVIEGYPVKKGDSIVIPINVNQKISKYWLNPEAFDPKRFLQTLSQDQKLLFMPFGFGKFSCIGSQYAIMQCMLILFNLLPHYDFALTPGCSLKRAPGVLNKLNENVTMKIYKKN